MAVRRRRGCRPPRACVLATSVLLLSAGCSRENGTSPALSGGSAQMTAASAYGVCAPCHHANGLGVPNAYPSLVGTQWVIGDPELLIKVTLHGLQGPIAVNGRPWSAMMMPFSNLPDAQIAAALTHARTSWGNAASPITAEQVARVRAEHAGRTKPWTSEELGNPK